MPQHEGAKPRRVVEIANVPTSTAIVQAASPSEVFTVGYLGSLIEGRNLLTVIEACGEMAEQGVRLVIGGFGPLGRARWKPRPVACQTFLSNWLPYQQMLAEEAGFDLFLHMTDPTNESQKWVSPNKLFEAMAFGKPIIVGTGTLTSRRVETFKNSNTWVCVCVWH